jgi:hypothetical protein
LAIDHQRDRVIEVVDPPEQSEGQGADDSFALEHRMLRIQAQM